MTAHTFIGNMRNQNSDGKVALSHPKYLSKLLSCWFFLLQSIFQFLVAIKNIWGTVWAWSWRSKQNTWCTVTHQIKMGAWTQGSQSSTSFWAIQPGSRFNPIMPTSLASANTCTTIQLPYHCVWLTSFKLVTLTWIFLSLSSLVIVAKRLPSSSTCEWFESKYSIFRAPQVKGTYLNIYCHWQCQYSQSAVWNAWHVVSALFQSLCNLGCLAHKSPCSNSVQKSKIDWCIHVPVSASVFSVHQKGAQTDPGTCNFLRCCAAAKANRWALILCVCLLWVVTQSCIQLNGWAVCFACFGSTT